MTLLSVPDAAKLKKLNAFTLLEVLIALGVLFIVGSAVVSLSNSLIQGTVRVADTTVTNLWTAEGLELVSKIRDDNFRSPSSNEPNLWIEGASTTDDYGWYFLQEDGVNKWKLVKASLGNTVRVGEAYSGGDSIERKTSEEIVATRLICIEAIQAASPATSTEISCNTSLDGSPILNDGSRTALSDCDAADYYCNQTKDSLNLNNLSSTIIPAGNAVKVRSVVIWPHRNDYRTDSMAMFLTNWRSYDQL